MADIRDVEVIAPHFKRRLSGVTSTIIQLVPRQRAAGVKIVTLGPGLPEALPKMAYHQIPLLWRRPASRPARVWHARRNIEMVAGVLLRDVLGMPLKLIFTSAAQRYHSGFTKRLLKRMDAVVATSARSGSFLEVPHEVVMHGIDTDLFLPGTPTLPAEFESRLSGRKIIGCSGRIRAQKGTDLFVEAMIALLPHHPGWSAVITGRVTPEHRAFTDGLMAQVREARLEDRILFTGEVDDIKPWYQRFSLYVAPSRNEGFGLTPLEAMASRTPVVASNAGAYAEMIVNGTGCVVPAGDGPALTAAIEAYLGDDTRLAREAEAALAHVRSHHPLEGEVEGLSRIYARLLG